MSLALFLILFKANLSHNNSPKTHIYLPYMYKKNPYCFDPPKLLPHSYQIFQKSIAFRGSNTHQTTIFLKNLSNIENNTQKHQMNTRSYH
uniref:Uncharacterized protein n=1 Tax=Solanum tuberosum TaxID=4113 RepID=M0ZTI3_SOLTU